MHFYDSLGAIFSVAFQLFFLETIIQQLRHEHSRESSSADCNWWGVKAARREYLRRLTGFRDAIGERNAFPRLLQTLPAFFNIESWNRQTIEARGNFWCAKLSFFFRLIDIEAVLIGDRRWKHREWGQKSLKVVKFRATPTHIHRSSTRAPHHPASTPSLNLGILTLQTRLINEIENFQWFTSAVVLRPFCLCVVRKGAFKEGKAVCQERNSVDLALRVRLNRVRIAADLKFQPLQKFHTHFSKTCAKCAQNNHLYKQTWIKLCY